MRLHMDYNYRKETWGYLLQDYSSDRIWAIGNDILENNNIETYMADLCNNVFPYRQDGWFYRGKMPKNLPLSAPVSISWSLTDQCNSNCVFCCNNSTQKGNYGIETGSVFKIIDKLKDLGVLRIIFGGGEPTLRKDLCDILKYTKMKGIHPAIATNGILMSQDLIEQFCEVCCTLQVSLDTLNREKYCKLRGIDKLSVVKNKIINAAKKNAPLRIVTVVNKENFDELDDIAAFISENGIRQWFIFNVLRSGRARNLPDDFFVEEATVMKKVQQLFIQFPDIEIFTWGTGDNDQISTYVESNGNVVIRNYQTQEVITLNSDSLSEFKNAWDNFDTLTKTKSLLNFIQPNLANPNNYKGAENSDS